jgi:hypothetical protein
MFVCMDVYVCLCMYVFIYKCAWVHVYVYKTTQNFSIIFEFYVKNQYRQEQEFQ